MALERNSILKTSLAAARYVNQNKDKSCSCEYCLKTFETVSALFRHISHAKSCSSHYGKVYVEGMRKELRINSKRKWSEANRDSIKNAPKKKYYFPISDRLTNEGQAFQNIFRNIFQDFRKLAQNHIEEHLKNKQNFYDDEDIDKALDETFDFLDWELHRNMPGYQPFEGIQELENEEDSLNLYFTQLEKRFQNNLSSIDTANKRYYWRKEQEHKIGSELWTFCSNKAFLTIYNEDQCKQVLESSGNAALDEIFFKLIVTKDYFLDDIDDEDLETKMSQTYSGIYKKEIQKRFEEMGITEKMRNLMKGSMKKRIYADELEYLNPY